jgi:Rieske Fe-S protein
VEAVSQEKDFVALKLSDGTTLKARDVVCATNSSIAGPVTLHTKMAPYRTYAMAFSVPRGSITDALYWDTLKAYHYVRLQPGVENDFLIIGGEDHKTGEANDATARFAKLETWTRTRFKNAAEITHRWSGQVLEPIDFAGFVGQHPDHSHVWLVTGDSGQGITNGAVAGLLLPTLMEANDHPWRQLYDPARITLMAAGDFVAENVTAVKGMAEHLEGPILPTEDSLGPGEGGLVRHGLKTAAVFRDSYGVVHRLASSCSHLGCTVHFNTFECCWDCPCHGSHFALDGEALNAPATAPLKNLE